MVLDAPSTRKGLGFLVGLLDASVDSDCTLMDFCAPCKLSIRLSVIFIILFVFSCESVLSIKKLKEEKMDSRELICNDCHENVVYCINCEELCSINPQEMTKTGAIPWRYNFLCNTCAAKKLRSNSRKSSSLNTDLLSPNSASSSDSQVVGYKRKGGDGKNKRESGDEGGEGSTSVDK